jgi:hypothetical protein
MRAVASATILGVVVAGLGSTFLQADSSTASHTHTRLLESYGRLPLHFERNDGQVDPSVRFLTRGSGYSLFLKSTEAVLALRQRATANVAVLQFTLAGGNRRPTVAGHGELPGRINYLVGNDPAGWRTNIATYARVHYTDVYPGIDLVYYGNQQQLEYDFVVAPGADPRRIRMAFHGARDVSINADGDLILSIAGGEVRQRKPIVYQDARGVREPVHGRYVMKRGRQVGFELGAYDQSRPLVIDPVLVYSTYLGGSSRDEGNDIAVDANGNAYVGGETVSADFPIVSGAYSSLTGGTDGFVTKLNSTGSTLIYSTYLGGAAEDRVNGVAVDTLGYAYATGETNPSAVPFPTTAGAFDTTGNGALDGFVAKLDVTGATLIYSTYLGGASSDRGIGIALDPAGNAYVTGQTFSSAFPTTAAAFDRTLDGFDDAFVTKVNTAGSGLEYSTYLGGGSTESGNGIAVDGAGYAYVTGQTMSLSPPFPTTLLAFDSSRGGASDAFVTKLSQAGSALEYSTYLGGSSEEIGNGIAVDDAGKPYVTGETSSDDFPTTPGALDISRGGISDAFVTKLSLNLTGPPLAYSTYLGGTSGESGTDIAVDRFSNAHVTGSTSSTNFPTSSDAVQSVAGGGGDAFVSRLDAVGSALVHSTYLGGNNADSGNGIAVDSRGHAYVTGVTQSANFPTSAGAFDADGSTIGAAEAFVAKIGGGVPAVLTLDPASDTNPVDTLHCVMATVTDASGDPVPDTMVRFAVMGAVDTSGSGTTDAAGQADFCYDGPTVTGLDAISAFADTNQDDTQDTGEPGGRAAKTWVAGPPATLTLTPEAETNPVATQHCVIAAVHDVFANATPDITVRFEVTGAVSTTGSATTDVNGQAMFCYAGPTAPGADAISAFADTDEDGAQGAGEPAGAATKTWIAGAPATLTLTPSASSNDVGGQHCVTATVRDLFANATPDITVDFQVTGASTTIGSSTTNGSGDATFCYTGPLQPGVDAITAYADTDEDGGWDPAEPIASATKTWVAGPPAAFTLTPAAATNDVGTQHCVVAAVKDAFGNATPGVTVRFQVTGAVNTTSAATTDAAGQATFCYRGPLLAGADAIKAYADADEDGTQDAEEPGGGAAKTWVAGAPATLSLTPGSASNPVGTQHCVMAAASDAFGNPTPGVTVRFRVTGAVNTTSSATTEADGHAIFCYEGPLLPGADQITAYADTDGDEVQDPGEPGGTAAKEWTLPVAAECKVTGGGYITTSRGSRATFGGVAQSIDGEARGMQAYVDHGSDRAPKVLLHSLNIDAVMCEGATATIIGRGQVHRYGTVEYRIYLTDGERDTYSIVLSNGYASGEQVVMGGNIRIH